MDWKEEFMSAIGPVDPAELDFKKAHALIAQNFPKCLYRFRKMSGNEVDNLKEDCVWLTSPLKYNDPFDSAVTFSPERLSDGIYGERNPIKTVVKLFSRLWPAVAEIDFDKVMKPEFDRMIQSFSEYLQSGMRVCSFCEDWDSIVMWSHYADQHMGFCIEYSTNDWGVTDVRRNLLRPVLYRSDLFDVTEYMLKGKGGAQFNNLFGVLACLLKAAEWAYEKEWRLVIPGGEAIPEGKYPMPKPSRIILGARMRQADEAQLTDVARRRRIPVFRAEVSRRRFCLELSEVPQPAKAVTGK